MLARRRWHWKRHVYTYMIIYISRVRHVCVCVNISLTLYLLHASVWLYYEQGSCNPVWWSRSISIYDDHFSVLAVLTGNVFVKFSLAAVLKNVILLTSRERDTRIGNEENEQIIRVIYGCCVLDFSEFVYYIKVNCIDIGD